MISTEKYMMAYLDILGGKRLITEDKDSTNLNMIYECYLEALKTIECVSKISPLPYEVKIFSDNIIIATKSNTTMSNDNHPVISLSRICAITGAFQRMLLNHNILVRGCITYGDLYIDNLIVWGSELVEAYKMESEIAKYPRIVISNKVKKLDGLLFDCNYELLQLNNIIEDEDGEFFLDYLGFPDANIKKLINASYNYICTQIQNETDNGVKDKLTWHINYLNSKGAC